jgi:hypothetical protein
MDSDPAPIDPATWLKRTILKAQLPHVPGVYEVRVGGSTQRPGGNASIEELRSWVARDMAAGKNPEGDVVWLVASSQLNGSPAFLLEVHNVVTGETEALALPFRRPVLGKHGRIAGSAQQLPSPPPISPTSS